MADDRLRVEITAEGSGLQDGLSKAKSAVSQAAADWESSFKSAESAISGSAAQIVQSLMTIGPAAAVAAAAFAAFEAAKSAIEGFVNYAGNVERLSEVLGISAEAASGLSASLRVLGVSSDEYISVTMRLERQLKTHEERFKALGVAVRDSTGAFLPQTQILDNVVSKMQEYKAGADQVQFAMDALGPRGADLAFRFLHLKEATEIATPIMKELGLAIGEKGVAAARQLEMQLASLGLVFTAIKAKIGEELQPYIKVIIGEFGSMAMSISGTLIPALRGLLIAFEAVFLPVKELMDLVVGTVFATANAITGVLSAALKALKGDFSGAIAEMRATWKQMQVDGATTAEEMTRDFEKASEKIKALWSGDKKDDVRHSKRLGDKSYTSPEAGGAAAGAEKSRMSDWESDLKAKEVAEKAFFGLSAGEEEEFWTQKLELAKKGTDEYRAVQEKLYELALKAGKESFEADQKNAKEAEALADRVAADQAKNIETEIKVNNEAVKAKEKAIETKYSLAKIGVSQEIAQLRDLENARYAAESAELSRELALWNEGQKQFAAVQNKMRQAAAQHDAALSELSDKAAKETQKSWDKVASPIKSAFDGMFQGIMQGTQTFNQVMLKTLDNLGAAFLQMGLKIAEDWIEKQIMAAVTGKATQTASAMSQIASNAAVAASAAIASTAAIPVIGPEMAPEAGAAAFAEAMSWADLASAMGGYDIPAGVNPVTQLHAEEMVLPPSLANAVRTMAAGGGNAGVNRNNYGHTYNISAIGPKDVAEAIKHAHRMNRRF